MKRRKMDNKKNPLYYTLASYYRIAGFRNKMLKPLTFLLTLLKVTPNMISYSALICMSGFVFLINHNRFLAAAMLAAAVIIDNIDGPLARYQKNASDKGKFVDVCCDQITFALFMIGIIYAGLVNQTIGAVYLSIMFFSRVFRVVRHSFYVETDWHFKPIVGFLPIFLTALTFIAFGVFLFFQKNYLTVISVIFSAILLVDLVYNFTQIVYGKKYLTISKIEKLKK